MAENLDLVKNLSKASERIKATLPKQGEVVPPTNGAQTQEPPKVETPPVTENKVPPPPPQEEKKEAPIVTQPTNQPSEVEQLLKKYGLNSISELEQKLTPQRQKPPEEEEAEIVEFGVKSGDLKMEQFINAKKLKDEKDRDVVFQDFAKKLQSRNKNISQEEIQKKFDRKFGDTITDEDGVTEKVIYDDDEISDIAKNIRESAFAPINHVKSKYQNYTTQQQTERNIANEFKELSSKIPTTINIQIDDKNSVPYEIEPKYRESLLPKLEAQYKFIRTQSPNEQLDFDAFVKHVVLTDNFGNIMNIYAGKKVSEKEMEYVKTHENPITETGNTNTSQPAVDMKAEAGKLGKQLSQFVK